MAVPLLIKDLHVRYGALEAVQGVNITVPDGKVVGILGANGAGKSSVLKAVAGTIRSAAGEIWLDDKRIDGMGPHQSIKLGLATVPEGRRVFAGMTVEENLRLGAYSRNDKPGIEQDLQTMFERFPILKERRKQHAGTLSGGEQGQLAIARALMVRPRFLLLDEPIQGLSPVITDLFFDIILKLRDEGVTIMMVEHNVHFVLNLSSYLYLMEQGKVRIEGEPKELTSSEYVQMMYLGR
ncbi:MAG: ABC transporter ATP-binding protein [SAR202 cluster bacterium]|nr:ABC transporter ATP-binding protein [SAR202 cluster bacterium]